MNTALPHPISSVPTVAGVFSEPQSLSAPHSELRFVQSATEQNTLGDAELSALVADGVLSHVIGSLYADGPVNTPATRAQALKLISDRRWGADPVFCRWSAAWVYGVAGVPAIIEFISDIYVHPFKDHRQLHYRNYQLNFDRDLFWRVGETAVVSPEQCVAELLVHDGSPAAVIAAAALLRGTEEIRSKKLDRAMRACDTIGQAKARNRALAQLDSWRR